MRVASALLIGLASCTDPDYVIEYGVLVRNGEGPMVSAADTVRVGEPLLVNIATIADSCVSFDSTDIDGNVVRVYDRRSTSGRPCPAMITFQRHPAKLVFDTPGPVTVVVLGWQYSHDGYNGPIGVHLPILVE